MGIALKFEVYKNGQRLTDFTLSGAYMFGADMIPFHHIDYIRFKDGLIECSKKSPDSAGLTLLWPVEGMGRILLPTTRLPERPEPYNLNVELARARLMQVTLKREDWSLFDEDNTFADLAHEAQKLFIKALQHISDPPKAAEYADQSLRKGLDFSERLAARYADQFLIYRLKNKGLGRHSLGCVIDPDRIDDDAYKKWVTDIFGYVTIPVTWADVELEKGEYDFDFIDDCIQQLAGRRIAVCVGPLLRFDEASIPDWLKQKDYEFEKIREYAYEFVSKIVGKYSQFIHIWRVISGMNALNYFEFNFEQILEMTRTACLAAKGADSKSRKIVEIVHPWGEYYAYNKASIPPLVYADMVIQSGMNFDAFGLDLQFGKDQAGMHVRDMLQISSRLDCFAAVPKPLHVTGVCVPGASGSDDEMAPAKAGYWRKPWAVDVQAVWIEQFYKLALGRPFVNTVTYSQLVDDEDMPLPECGLIDEDLKAKKAMMPIAKLQKLIVKPPTK